MDIATAPRPAALMTVSVVMVAVSSEVGGRGDLVPH